ncbi:MAG: VWA domain-containing protein [Anaerolineales bacterium]
MSFLLDSKRNANKRRWEQGQTIVLLALGMMVLIAAVGLATDAILIYKTKQDLQRAIDSAALAAAYKLPDKTLASQAAYEFMRLHNYDFDPTSNPLQITFPVYTPPRKALKLVGTVDANLAFMKVFGFAKVKISAAGEAESAPMDVYLILDLSESMTYDTYYTQRPSPKPSWWVYQSDEIAQWCNAHRNCDPLDEHLKPAAKFFIDQFDAQYDRVGVVAYDTVGVQIIPLSSDFVAVKTAIDNLDAFDHQFTSDSSCPIYNNNGHHCNKNTNIGDGIMIAHDKIASEGRLEAIWSIVLETDGRANVYRNCNGCPPDCGSCTIVRSCDECQAATDWAINHAKDTWKRHETVIYTIAYGDLFTQDPQYKDLMIDIADWTDNGVLNGTTNDFWTAPDEDSLRVALKEIAERIYARLIQ